MKLKYCGNMSPQELTEFLAEVTALDEAYEQAMEQEATSDYDEMAELCRAALNHRGQP